LTAEAFSWKRTNQKKRSQRSCSTKSSSSAASDRTQKPKSAQNNREYVVLNIATQESWKNDKGDYETRTEWHRVYASRNLSKFAKTLQKGQLITLEGTSRYREVEDEVEGTTFEHRIAEIHATSMKRLSKIETADDPTDGADDE
jgi:single-strand DNA-binding protein